MDNIEGLKEQLTLKTQECERWKSNFNGKVSAIEDILQQLDQLKAGNEDLKKRFKKFHDRKLNENADLLCKLHKEECLRFKAEQKLERIKEDITKIKDCATTEMVEIATRKDYNGFLALKAISAKTTQMLKIIDEVE